MITVTLLNPEVVRDLYQNHGEFACTCYNTPARHAERVGIACQASGHMSGSRCEYIKFKISGLDRGTAEQCMRHEIGTNIPLEMQDNYSFEDVMDDVITVPPDQIVKNCASFRYIDKTGFEWEPPYSLRKCPAAKEEYDALMQYINDKRLLIKEILEASGCPSRQATQDANFVLPRATTTELVIGFSGLYTADVDGKPAVIGRDKGKGFTIRLESKPGWDMINHYDEEGSFEGTTFEKQEKEEE